MKIKKLIWTAGVLLTVSGIGIPAVLAQDLRSSDVELKSRRFPKDRLGTNVRNIHTFDVEYKDKSRQNRGTYVVVFYIDGKPITQFENVRLPYTFHWNFNGMRPGQYAIKIDIEDREGNLLATQETTVDVVRRK